MAIDTASKRGSAIHVSLPFRALLPLPDSTIDQGDRQHAALLYSGILAGGAPTGPAIPLLAYHYRHHLESMQ